MEGLESTDPQKRSMLRVVEAFAGAAEHESLGAKTYSDAPGHRAPDFPKGKATPV